MLTVAITSLHSFFSTLQEIESPHASVGSPLDGQKVKLFTFLFPVFHCIYFLMFPCLSVYLSLLPYVSYKYYDSVYFHLISDEQNYCNVVFLVYYKLEFECY